MSTTTDTKSHTFADGRTLHTYVTRPFIVRNNGRTRAFGSYATARAAANGGDQIFFDYEPGCGRLIEVR